MEVLGDSPGSPQALVQPSSTFPSPFEVHPGWAAFWHLPVAAQKGLGAETAKSRALEELPA